jgi:hypothetical protein
MEENIFLLVLGLLALFLVFQRWFWLLVFGLGGLAACFAMIASVIHFQILGAIGFFILMMILWSIADAIAD